MSYLFWFCSAQLLVGIAFVLGTVLSARSKFSVKLRLHYQILLSLVVILIAQTLLPVYRTYAPLQNDWVASTQTLQKQFEITPRAPAPNALHLVSEKQIHFLFAYPNMLTIFFFAILVFWIGFKLFRDMRELSQIKRESFRVRRIGRVLILAHDHLPVPMTYWTPQAAVVIIPAAMLSDPLHTKISLLHELQHQRQRDPLWTLALEIFKIFSFVNPLAKLWIRKINELQEFACDEALIGRSKVSSEQYARCLLQVAESALHAKRIPACATGLFFRMERYPLKRRIQMLLSMKKENRVAGTRSPKIWPKLILVAILIGGAAYTTKGIAESQSDRTITKADAQTMALQITHTDGLPIVINEAVLRELNLDLESPAKRQILRDGLARMKDEYQLKIDSMLTSYELPRVLDAMPMVESRYQNLKQSGSMKSAGLWQFIPSTARNMGLTISENEDERLNVDKLNEAAGRLIKSNQLFYKDTTLAVLAFNWGDARVNQLMKETDSRDPWVIAHANHDDTYLPKVVAAALIIGNPKSLE
jgi:membrane-bound lytic murein transglycosylase D